MFAGFSVINFWTFVLWRTLEFINNGQNKRDNKCSLSSPTGECPSGWHRKPTEKKSLRLLNDDDMLEALGTLQSHSEDIFGTRK